MYYVYMLLMIYILINMFLMLIDYINEYVCLILFLLISDFGVKLRYWYLYLDNFFCIMLFLVLVVIVDRDDFE